jgi:hypothetical protein
MQPRGFDLPVDSSDFVPNPPPDRGRGGRRKGTSSRDFAEARKQVETRPQDSGAAYNLARVYASLDMIEEAFEWLGKALKLGFENIQFVREDPVLLGLKKDPRFTAMLEGK